MDQYLTRALIESVIAIGALVALVVKLLKQCNGNGRTAAPDSPLLLERTTIMREDHTLIREEIKALVREVADYQDALHRYHEESERAQRDRHKDLLRALAERLSA